MDNLRKRKSQSTIDWPARPAQYFIKWRKVVDELAGRLQRLSVHDEQQGQGQDLTVDDLQTQGTEIKISNPDHESQGHTVEAGKKVVEIKLSNIVEKSEEKNEGQEKPKMLLSEDTKFGTKWRKYFDVVRDREESWGEESSILKVMQEIETIENPKAQQNDDENMYRPIGKQFRMTKKERKLNMDRKSSVKILIF